MKITPRHYDPVVILDLDGSLTIGEGDVALRRAILELLEEGHRHIILNCLNLRTMDSSGLGELIRCKTTCNARGAELKLLHLNPKVYDLLEVTRLIGIFEIHDQEVDAIPSFWNGEPGSGGEAT